MSSRLFGWDLPPGVTNRMIGEQATCCPHEEEDHVEITVPGKDQQSWCKICDCKTDITPEMSTRQNVERVEVKVSGIVKGFKRDDETVEEAQARIVLEAEMAANAPGDPRLHLQVEGDVR